MFRQLPLERLKKLAKQVNDFCSTIDETFGHHVKALEEEAASWIKDLSALTPGTPAHQSTTKSPVKKTGVFDLPNVSNPPEVVKAAAQIAQVLKAYFQFVVLPQLGRDPVADKFPIQRRIGNPASFSPPGSHMALVVTRRPNGGMDAYHIELYMQDTEN